MLKRKLGLYGECWSKDGLATMVNRAIQPHVSLGVINMLDDAFLAQFDLQLEPMPLLYYDVFTGDHPSGDVLRRDTAPAGSTVFIL